MTRNWLLLLIVILFLSACVPNRRYVYLQNADVRKNGILTDSVLRSYPMKIHEYRIQPLDLLYIRVESLTPGDFDFINKLDAVPDYNSTTGGGNTGGGAGANGGGGGVNPLRIGFLVDTDGYLEYPVLGKVKLEGQTVFEAQNTLKELFKSYLKLPSVRVRLLNFRFTVLGEVNAEQQVISTNTRVNFMEAIGMAGGFTDLADRKKIKVVRQKGSTSEVFYLNVLDEKLVASPFYFIQQNDIIVVPPLRQRPLRRYFAQNLALLTITISSIFIILTLSRK